MLPDRKLVLVRIELQRTALHLHRGAQSQGGICVGVPLLCIKKRRLVEVNFVATARDGVHIREIEEDPTCKGWDWAGHVYVDRWCPGVLDDPRCVPAAPLLLVARIDGECSLNSVPGRKVVDGSVMVVSKDGSQYW